MQIHFPMARDDMVNEILVKLVLEKNDLIVVYMSCKLFILLYT